MNKRRLSILVHLIALSLFVSSGWAKSAAQFQNTSVTSSSAAQSTSQALRSLQERATPYLTWRITPGASITADQRIAELTQADLFAIARNWDRLDPQFLALYKQSREIPSGMVAYNSPGGSFVIYYARTGTSAVDLTDNYRFGTPDWRSKTSAPNGVPDYIDEIAWAADSVWQAEAVRFGFSPYLPYDSNRRFQIIVTTMRQGDYGLTSPEGPIGGGRPGFYSSFEMRNSWLGWTNPPYESNPTAGARVTIAHEFFHVIQYAMTHQLKSDIELDDYPVSWLEAGAVLMEELVFDEINDYVQYAYDLFANPTEISLFSRGTSYYYLNGIPLLYMNERIADNNGVAFVRSIYENNYNSPRPFYPQLFSAADSFGTSWAELLSGFHAQSYFTGSRARSGMFIEEAARLPQWTPPAPLTMLPVVQTKTVKPFSMQIFTFAPPEPLDDTITIQLLARLGTDSATGYTDAWGGHVMLKRRNESVYDPLTLTPFTVSNRGNDTLSIAAGSAYNAVMVIATNLDPQRSGRITLALDTLLDQALFRFADDTGTVDIDTPRVVLSRSVFPNPAALSSDGGVWFSGKNMYAARVYDRAGTLVWDRRFSESYTDTASGFRWNLTDMRGNQVPPGAYIVALGYSDTLSAARTTVHQKLFVKP